LRRLLLLLLAVAGVLVLVAAASLWAAHRDIAAIDPPLPEPSALMNVWPDAGLPVRLSWLNTASQPSPRSSVLEASLDPDTDAPYVMSHPAFMLEWADGRVFLVDTGMTREAAIDFGAMPALVGADAIEPLGSIAEQLGDSVRRVAGVAFTHLHQDHTSGITTLCQGREGPLPVYQAPLQFERGNYTTLASEAHLRQAECAARTRLDGGALDVPGFPGLRVIQAGGHTPGSQVFVVRVAGADGLKSYLLTGDVVNHIDGVRLNLPKPHLYSLLLVPESTGRLARMRVWLKGLADRHGATLLVSHDQLALEASGLPRTGG
jgi:glyoxylase-like metal-dependent hydrolase (beta-lactamase superfamily II)